MGNNGSKRDRVVPEKGYRVRAITRKSLTAEMDLLTDYILSPDPKKIDLRRQSIKFEIYSILNEEIRTVEIPIENSEIGINLKLENINPCILRITKIFANSPLEKKGIVANEFIVGILQGSFSSIKQFAQLVTSITSVAPKSQISLGISNQSGNTRIVKVEVADLITWNSKGKGLLGCELAEGWIHRWKQPKQKKQEEDEPKIEQQKRLERINEIPKLPKIDMEEELDSAGSSDEVDRKCDALDEDYNAQGVMEIRFKGVLRNEEIIDASTICKCRPVDKQCEKCFIQKDSSFYFFNKKSRQIVAVPISMMLRDEE